MDAWNGVSAGLMDVTWRPHEDDLWPPPAQEQGAGARTEKFDSYTTERARSRGLLQVEKGDCALSRSQRAKALDKKKRTWLIDNSVMESVGNDLQAVINCTSAGDTVLLAVGKSIKLTRRVEIQWPLSVSAFVEETDLEYGVFPTADSRTIFRCPPNEGAFVVRSSGALLANVAFKRCSVDSNVHSAVVEVESCSAEDAARDFKLHHVSFTQNRFNQTSALFVRESDCPSVEMVDVDFEDNIVSQSCATHLSSKNFLRDVRMTGNYKTWDSDRAPAMLCFPSGSVTDASGLTVRRNNVSAILASGENLHLINSAFRGNLQMSVVRLENANGVTVRNCSFVQNDAGESNGAGVVATSSRNLTVSYCLFDGNRAENGGGVYASRESLTLVDCSFVRNQAAKSGGGASVADASLEISECVFHSNEAGIQAGAVSLVDHAAFSIEGSNFTENRAFQEGGAIQVSKSSGNISSCVLGGNNALSGGAIQLALASHVKMESLNISMNRATEKTGGGIDIIDKSTARIKLSIFSNNVARTHGGAVHVYESELKVHDVVFQSNNCTVHGAGVCLMGASSLDAADSRFLSNAADFGSGVSASDRSVIHMRNASFSAGQANKHGGGLYIDKNSSVSIQASEFVDNRAKTSGGGLHCSEAKVSGDDVLFARNEVDEIGGGIHVSNNCKVKFSQARIINNKSNSKGGGVSIRTHGQVKLTESKLRKNDAESDGGAVFIEAGTLRVKDSDFIQNSAHKGGSISAVKANIAAGSSGFYGDTAGESGGSVEARRGTYLDFLNTTIASGASRAAGCVYLENSNLTGHRLHIKGCMASQRSGGGILASYSSSILCSSCKFDHNNASGFGGAIFIRTREPQGLAYQFAESLFRGNNATLGGGIYFSSEYFEEDCGKDKANCTFVSLAKTKLVDNSASAGGAIFASDPTAFRFSCTGQVDTLSVIKSQDYPCLPAMKNEAKVFGHFIASAARRVNATIKDASGDDDLPKWRGRTLPVNNYKSGQPLPTVRFEVVDEFGQGPAIGADNKPVTANMISPQGFFNGSVNLVLADGTAEFSGIASFTPPGDYNVTISFSLESLQNFTIMVSVQSCAIGSSSARDARFCRQCSESEYNFSPTDSDCRLCPENGNCTPENVVHPMKGYWQGNPCSLEIQECLAPKACDYEERDEKMREVTKDLKNCSGVDMELSAEYTEAQCREGYKDALCGSCEGTHGRTRSLECAECRKRYISVLMYLLSVFLLLLLTGFAIKNNLATRAVKGRIRMTRQGSYTNLINSPSNIQMAEIGTPVQPEHDIQSQNENNHESSLHRAEIAKHHTVEIFKIMINFLQVIAIAWSINVNWTSWMVSLFSAADFLGGAAIEGITLPVECLLSADMSVPRSILRTAILLTIPAVITKFFIVFWALATHRSAKPWSYFAKRLLLSILVVVYLAYESVTKTAVHILYCVSVHDSFGESTSLWAMDTSVRCYRGWHAVLAGVLGWPIVICYSLGFPIGLACVLAWVKPGLDKGNVCFDEVTGFLCRAYKEKLVFWESVIMLRKAFLAVIVSLGHQCGGNVQGILAVCVLTIALYIHTSRHPFKDEFDRLNRYEGASLFVSQLTCASGLFFNDEGITDAARLCITVVLFLMVGGLSCFFLFQMFACLATYSRIVLEAEGMEVVSWGRVRTIAAFLSSRVEEHFSFLTKCSGNGAP